MIFKSDKEAHTKKIGHAISRHILNDVTMGVRGEQNPMRFSFIGAPDSGKSTVVQSILKKAKIKAPLLSNFNQSWATAFYQSSKILCSHNDFLGPHFSGNDQLEVEPGLAFHDPKIITHPKPPAAFGDVRGLKRLSIGEHARAPFIKDSDLLILTSRGDAKSTLNLIKRRNELQEKAVNTKWTGTANEVAAKKAAARKLGQACAYINIFLLGTAGNASSPDARFVGVYNLSQDPRVQDAHKEIMNDASLQKHVLGAEKPSGLINSLLKRFAPQN